MNSLLSYTADETALFYKSYKEGILVLEMDFLVWSFIQLATHLMDCVVTSSNQQKYDNVK